MSKQKKIGIIALSVVLLVQVFFIFKRVHNFPFMIYDMYSRPEYKADYSNQFLVIADNDTINLIALPIMKEGVIINSLKVYSDHIEKGGTSWEVALDNRRKRLGKLFDKRADKYLTHSKDDVESYPFWLKTYIEQQVTRNSIQHLKVYEATIETRYGLKYKENLLIDVNE